MILYTLMNEGEEGHGTDGGHEPAHPFERVMMLIGQKFPSPETVDVQEIIDWALLELSMEISEEPLAQIAEVLNRVETIYEFSALFYSMMYADMGKEINPIEGLMMIVPGRFA